MKGEFASKPEEFDMEKAKRPYITAFKGSFGHLNMASGTTEVAAMLMSMKEGFIPAIYGLENPIIDLNFVTHNKPVKKNPIKTSLKYALGMGLQTAAVAFQSFAQ
mmetsp:Transcript_29157/g.21700  ORF Transcript_29157/g.21700 Transcript_29157/m.21700 type:complete len:105 (+) Transcript_29157:1035-1349(+)|eukprot:CAMPEP_0202971154 /NCGR_PEP_ID=MMETSP1396-20130829/24505_1 /ASSEMBLY_ACC=CAM_ASM_000872 /TAXON_ID= /ORGANISM="Pseudokeronopsis sp., Strain Brazil" /LENGTH=104 /DNA_ID=CAMNT_0049700253 /DNA_START=1026 /DNA_END=1340 /DNA_ORIENTATION=+